MFAGLFKIKKLICFTLIKNEHNNNAFTDIIEKYSKFEHNGCKLVYDSESVVKETTNETK